MSLIIIINPVNNMLRIFIIILININFIYTYSNTNLYNFLPPEYHNNLNLLGSLEEDADLSTPELIKKYGYPSETHKVITEDKYILTLHRIPHGQYSEPGKIKPIVFLQHGLLSSSVDWIVTGPQKGLGYLLADRGYDVWMGNFRGNTYSRHNQNIPTNSAEFWNFSWHELGTIDLPAMINYVLNCTQQEKMFYIGHSQGTTAFYVMVSEKPEYNKNFRAMFSLAPIAFMSHMKSPGFQILAKGQAVISIILKLIGVHEFLPSSKFMKFVGKTFCNDDSFTQFLCTNSMFLMCGFNKDNLNTTIIPVIMAHTPAGASTKQFLHYAQLINSGKFRQYDYGILKNLKIYGNKSPPEYDLSKITVPVALHSSHNDWLASESDVDLLHRKLGNSIGKIPVMDPNFNHLDYIWGINAPEVLYFKIFSLMNNY